MLIIFSVILILLTVILRNVLRKRKLSFVVFILSVIIFVGCLFVFYYTMSELAKVTVGSFIGNGNIDVNIYADNIFESIPCRWGPGVGFYLFIASLIILIFGIFVTFRKKQT